jgi:hypothetical protein
MANNTGAAFVSTGDFQADSHAMKESIGAIIAAYKAAWPGMGVQMAYSEAKGLDVQVKPSSSFSYSVKAGVTTPLAKRAPKGSA